MGGSDGHPMHLHGVTAQVVAVKNRGMETQVFSGPRRDTVFVPVGGEVTIVFDAVNPGQWLFHCHIDDHAEGGMMTSLPVRMSRWSQHHRGMHTAGLCRGWKVPMAPTA